MKYLLLLLMLVSCEQIRPHITVVDTVHHHVTHTHYDTMFITAKGSVRLADGVGATQDWTDICCGERILTTWGWYHGCIVYHEFIVEQRKGEIPDYLKSSRFRKITDAMKYREKEKAEEFLADYTRKKHLNAASR